MQGIPIKMILSSGNRHDIKFVEDLIKDVKVETILADRGYDAKTRQFKSYQQDSL